MKIAFIIPFYYKWENYSNCRANYEYLQIEGHEVDVFSKSEIVGIDYMNWHYYDIVMLHGSGAVLPEDHFKNCIVPIISFGWSDPNLFNITHYTQSKIYCTNDFTFAKLPYDKPVYFYNTACDKRYHKNLNLKKETDILVYGCGDHKFVTNRNKLVNKLRELGYTIKVFGRGWDQHSDAHGHIEGEEFIKEINKAHLVLDISNKTTAWPHRILESSACGTPVLTIDREDTRMMFKEWDEILLYKDFEDLIIKLSTALTHKKNLREIGLRAQKRCYKDHDISVRIKELLKIMEQL